MAWLGRLGALVAALTFGLLAGGALAPPLTVLSGAPSVDAGRLVLGAGDLVGVGTGRTLVARGLAASGGVDLVLGDPAGRHVVGHVGAVSGLFDDRLVPLGQEPPHPWVAGDGESTWTLDCQPPVRLLAGRTPLGTGEPVTGCEPQALAIGASGDLTVSGVSVDEVAVPLAAVRFVPEVAAASAVGLLVLGGLLGAAGQVVLFLAPLALLGPRLGLPGVAVFALVVGASLVQQAVNATGWRSRVGWVLAVVALPASVVALDLRLDDPGEQAWDADRPVTALISLEVVTRKVAIAEASARALLRSRDERPLAVALGSSSTGGDGRQSYWPAEVQRTLPELQVLNLAQGGATSWHMKELLERLDLRPDVCLFYMGHNDSMPGFPGITIRGLETGAESSGGWIAPVPAADARANVAAIAARCGVTLAMAEYVRGQEPAMAAYASALEGIEGVVLLDAAGQLASLPARSAMIDTVHPSEQGHRALGRYVAGELRTLLDQGAVALP